jgi:hypothetical protein
MTTPSLAKIKLKVDAAKCRNVTVLEIPQIESAETAERVQIVKDAKGKI